MKEYRLTFETENFGAISQALVDMGVSFRVEPMETARPKAASVSVGEAAATPRRPAKKKSAKSAAKKKAGRAGSAKSNPMANAERMLAGLARGGSSPSAAEPSRPTVEGSIGAPEPAQTEEAGRDDPGG